MSELSLPFGVYRGTRGDLDLKFRVADDAARDVLITNDLVKLGHIIYHEVDDKHYKLKTYPTFGDLTGVEWEEIGGKSGSFELKTDSTTSITLSSADKGKVISADSSSAITFTIDTTSLTDIGDIAYVDQMGSGEVTFVASGVTLQVNASRELKTDGQFSRVAIHKTAATTYRVFGELKQG